MAGDTHPEAAEILRARMRAMTAKLGGGSRRQLEDVQELLTLAKGRLDLEYVEHWVPSVKRRAITDGRERQASRGQRFPVALRLAGLLTKLKKSVPCCPCWPGSR